jgi:hypothetical protein
MLATLTAQPVTPCGRRPSSSTRVGSEGFAEASLVEKPGGVPESRCGLAHDLASSLLGPRFGDGDSNPACLSRSPTRRAPTVATARRSYVLRLPSGSSAALKAEAAKRVRVDPIVSTSLDNSKADPRALRAGHWFPVGRLPAGHVRGDRERAPGSAVRTDVTWPTRSALA